MTEAIRLVIWDLDDTFWTGTLAEGDDVAVVPAARTALVELARRGIISSICSKNDHATAKSVLVDLGLYDYFVFPSIDWTPKAARVAEIVAATNLRAETVLFIDDNESNLAEVAAANPGIQTALPPLIATLLGDARCRGASDPEMKRLQQYKTLELRHHDRAAATGDNTSFLRTSDIRVRIDYDVERHIDRTVELINRTNQLNFTKARLPEDPSAARERLRHEISLFNVQAGLVHVRDKYGDYGICGFFMVHRTLTRTVDGPTRTAIHLCFSCRTLGMNVERWLYQYLDRPLLTVVGDVASDILDPAPVDWVRLVDTFSDDATPEPILAPAIRFIGGCEADAIASYFRGNAARIDVSCNFHSGATFCRLNSIFAILSAMSRRDDAFAAEAERLALPYPLLALDPARDAAPGTVFIVGTGADPRPERYQRYVHTTGGWELMLEAAAIPTVDLYSVPPEQIIQHAMAAGIDRSSKAMMDILKLTLHLRNFYSPVDHIDIGEMLDKLRQFAEDLPEGARLVLLLDDPRQRGEDGRISVSDNVVLYNAAVVDLAAAYAHVGVAHFSDVILSDDEVGEMDNHTARVVYWRLSETIKRTLATLTPKPATVAAAP
jgi:FkbH-like protein